MVCPYRVVVGLVTIALAAMLSVGWELPWAAKPEHGPGEEEEDEGKREGVGGKQGPRPRPVAFKDRGTAHRIAYGIVIVAVVVFHVELFSGGMICRQMFAKVHPSAPLFFLCTMPPLPTLPLPSSMAMTACCSLPVVRFVPDPDLPLTSSPPKPPSTRTPADAAVKRYLGRHYGNAAAHLCERPLDIGLCLTRHPIHQ